MSGDDDRASSLRRRFTLLGERTYLATQCLGPFPDEMWGDLDEYRRSLSLRNRALEGWIGRMEELIGDLERLLGAPSGSVALRDSATAAQAAIAATVEVKGRRDRLVTSALDFHSSRYLWTAQRRRGFVPVEVAATPEHGHDAAALLAAIDERTAVVALSLVSPRSGALLDVAPIAAAARAAGALLILDAYQAVGALPVDVAQLGADAVVGGTHKWLGGGGTGLAFLHVRPELAERIDPVYPGWIGHREMVGFSEEYMPASGARRFQQGTPALEPIYTARAGLRFVLEVGTAQIRARSLRLTRLLLDGARQRGLATRTPDDDAARGGMVCFDVEGAEAVVAALEARGVDVDSRPGAGIRVSPHYCNDEVDCLRFLDQLASLQGQRRREAPALVSLEGGRR